MFLKIQFTGTSLEVQWLRLHHPNAGVPILIPGWGTRYVKLQLKVCMPQPRPDAVKEINKNFFENIQFIAFWGRGWKWVYGTKTEPVEFKKKKSIQLTN